MVDRQTVDIYAAKAADYISLDPTKTQIRALASFLSALPAHSRILDLGCGPGSHGAVMVAQGHQVTGLDATPGFVEAARLQGLDARQGDFDDVTEEASYDGVWASFSLLHAPRADFPRHLASIHRALIPGGMLFLGMKLGVGEARDVLGRFYSYYSEKELRDLLAQARFTGIQAITGQAKGLAGTDDPYILMTAYA